MLRSAKDRKIAVTAVLFDSWHAATQTMKAVRKLDWHWITKLKCHRTLNGAVRIEHRWKTTDSSVIATLAGDIHALIVKDGKEFFATSLLTYKPKGVKKAYRKRWMIEECIKLLKSEFGFETCQDRTIPAIRAHAYVCLMSF